MYTISAVIIPPIAEPRHGCYTEEDVVHDYDGGGHHRCNLRHIYMRSTRVV